METERIGRMTNTARRRRTRLGVAGAVAVVLLGGVLLLLRPWRGSASPHVLGGPGELDQPILVRGEGGESEAPVRSEPLPVQLRGIPPSMRIDAADPGLHPARIAVASDGASLVDALVQIVSVPGTGPAVRLAEPVRTLSDGLAVFELGRALPRTAWVEAMYVREAVYRRALVPLDEVAIQEGAIQSIHLPVGGTLTLDVSALPLSARPAKVSLMLIRGTRAHEDLLPGLAPVPLLGSLGLRVPPGLSPNVVAVAANGLTGALEVPPDCVVWPRLKSADGSWAMSAWTYTGSARGPSPQLPMLTVRSGRAEVLATSWVELPRFELAVRSATDRRPLAGARVYAGLRRAGGVWVLPGTRFTSGADGWIRGVVPPTGRLPLWSIDASTLILIVQSQGYRTALVKIPFAWAPMRGEVVLVEDSGLVWEIRGRLLLPNGQPASGAHLCIQAGSIEGQFSTQADESGDFVFRIDEGWVALFQESGEFRVALIGPYVWEDRGAQREFVMDRLTRFAFPTDPEQAVEVSIRLHPGTR